MSHSEFKCDNLLLYFLTSAGVTGLASHLVWQIRTVDLNNGKDCMDTFISNKWAGGILFAGCLGGRLLST